VNDSEKYIALFILVCIYLIDFLLKKYLKQKNILPPSKVVGRFSYVGYFKYWQRIKKENKPAFLINVLINAHIVIYIVTLLIGLIIIISFFMLLFRR